MVAVAIVSRTMLKIINWMLIVEGKRMEDSAGGDAHSSLVYNFLHQMPLLLLSIIPLF
jgi:hypothetical protein